MKNLFIAILLFLNWAHILYAQQNCDGRPCQLWDANLINCTAVGNELGQIKCWESELKTVALDAALFVTDGTVCADPAVKNVTADKTGWAVVCNTSSGGEFYIKITNMPSRWDGGGLHFELDGTMFNGTSATSVWDVSCACGVETSFGASQQITLNFSSLDTTIVGRTSAAVIPAGSCGGGKDLWCKFVLDDSNSSNVENIYFLGSSMIYKAVEESD